MTFRLLPKVSTFALSSATAVSAAMLASTLYEDTTRCQTADKKFRIEVHLMDKIQQKSYLETAKEGIPSTLRILAIDLPELRKEAFSGDCQLDHQHIYPDDLAPPKVVDVLGRKEESDGKHNKLRIAQKALVKSLVQCRSSQSQQKIGVEILEASVADLNRFKLRKKIQVGNFKYDPGKYYSPTNVRANDEGDEEIEEVDQAEILLDTAAFEDEIEAPWNQYAWIEELRLRINGQVPFGAPMERSSRFQRALFGNVFRETVPTVRRFWEWPLPSFAKSDPDGLDGRNQLVCRARSKPHAVIANGAALQRVPSSLRLLQKACRKANVPLFVIDDPRVWGGNTHQSLGEALQEMRATIKKRVISQALKQHGSSAFTRGRMLGQVETEAWWQFKEKKQRAKDLIKGEGRRRRKNAQEPKDWSNLDFSLLEKKLVERGVIMNKKIDETGNKRSYSDAMIEISRRCVNEIDQRDSNAKESTATKEEQN